MLDCLLLLFNQQILGLLQLFDLFKGLLSLKILLLNLFINLIFKDVLN